MTSEGSPWSLLIFVTISALLRSVKSTTGLIVEGEDLVLKSLLKVSPTPWFQLPVGEEKQG